MNARVRASIKAEKDAQVQARVQARTQPRGRAQAPPTDAAPTCPRHGETGKKHQLKPNISARPDSGQMAAVCSECSKILETGTKIHCCKVCSPWYNQCDDCHERALQDLAAANATGSPPERA